MDWLKKFIYACLGEGIATKVLAQCCQIGFI